MLRRPRAGETEQDLLDFQEKFLASREKASVSLVAKPVGVKRKQRTDERDVVSLTGDNRPARADGVSAAKRSKFKQQKIEKSRAESQAPPPALSDIQDCDVVDRPVTMPTWMTSRGFPSVQRLEWGDTKTPSPAAQTDRKKSLFAQQCDSHPPEFFGFEFKSTNQMNLFQRDRVQPFDMNSEPSSEAPPTSNESTKFSSTASQTWSNLLDSGPAPSHAFSPPSLISGEGLVGSKVSREAAAEEVKKIHSENIQRLREASEDDLRAERKRVEQVLGPDLVAFLKERGRRRERGENIAERGAMEVGEGRERGGVEEETGVVAPAAWVNMDKVEKEKMEWMTDVLPTDLKDEGPVRFSLDGLVVPRGTSLPSHSGLYHHGDEPAAAGYSLNELLSLVRSSVPQQRVWSLSTLSKIMNKAWRGGYRGAVSHEVLTALCGAGLPLLLRYAVDDSSTAVISSALAALHSLLVPDWEERLLCEMCGCHRGCSVPYMGPVEGKVRGRERERGEAAEEEEDEEEEDSEVMDRDVVQGYLATGLLRRLRYILEVVRPGDREVQLSLEIITRLARHSLQTATQVVECPRLMATIFSQFLPLVWTSGDGSSVGYGQPQPAAMRLLQVLVSVSRNLASLLLSRHSLLEVIVRYAVPHPSELSLPQSSAHSLSIAALQTGRALLHYDLASSWISDCYPVLSRHIFSLPSLSLTSVSLHSSVHLASIISLLEPATSLSSLPASLISSLLPPLLSGLAGWVRQAEGEQEAVAERLVCLRAALNTTASYFFSSSSKGDPLELIEMASSLSSPSGVVDSLSRSPLLRTALSGLMETSPLCCSSPSSPTSSPPSSLPSLHPSLPLPRHPAIYGGQFDNNIDTLLQPQFVYISSADFVLGFLRLCLAAGSTHKGVVSRVSQLLSDPRFKQYIGLVCNSAPVKYPCTVFGEFQLLHTAIRLFMMKVATGGSGCVSQEELELYHRLSLHLLSLLPPGMEGLVEDLISTTVFHPSLLHELSSPPESLLSEDLSSLTLHHPPQPLLPPDHAPLSSLLAATRDHLPSICSSLLTSISSAFFTHHSLDSSRNLYLSLSASLFSLTSPPYPAPLLPADWCVLPLVSLYQHSLSRSCDVGSEVIVTVRNSLSVQLLLEKLRPLSLCHLPPSTRLACTLLTFLIGSDLFLEREIRPLLSALLTSVYCSQTIQQVLDLTLPLPGLPSFHDLYLSLLSQYAAVSYGDPLFSCYLLLPLQRRFPVTLRRSVWDQFSHTLRLLSLPLHQLPVKVEYFLLPPETDHQLLDLYVGALSTGSVRPQWSPLMYLTAVHHIHHFLFSKREDEEEKGRSEDAVFREKLLLALEHMRNKETRNHVLYYAGVTGGSGLGFKISPEQTDTRRSS